MQPRTVCHRLTRLTAVDHSNANMKLDELHPKHYQALPIATLPNMPPLNSQNDPIAEAKQNETRTERDHKRTVHFKIACNFRTVPIHGIIINVKRRYQSLNLLGEFRSYSRRSGKSPKDMSCQFEHAFLLTDFMKRLCDCRNLDNGRKKIVVFQAECLNSGRPRRLIPIDVSN